MMRSSMFCLVLELRSPYYKQTYNYAMTDGPVEDVTMEHVKPQDEQQRKLLNTNLTHQPNSQER